MSVRVLPAVLAVIFALAVAVLLFVPFVAREYRRCGEFRAGTAALRFATLLYPLGLVAYVLVPLPPTAPGFCEAFGSVRPQWRPLGSLAGVPRPHSWAELSAVLSDGAVRQFGYNVVLFVPLGMLVRYLFRRGLATTVLTGFAVSLFLELTQLTGIWHLYPCAYRLFDIDDLIANTSGAAAGAVLAPLVRLLPGQRTELAATTARPVTAFRRLLGMCCDVLLLWWLGLAMLRCADLVAESARPAWLPRAWVECGALWFGPAVLLLVITVVGRGSTLGQYAVLLRSVEWARDRLPARRISLRWIAGIGGMACAEGLATLAGWAHWGMPLAAAWCLVHALGVTRSRDHRGISGRLAGFTVIDARSPREPVRATTHHRQLRT